MYYEEKHIEAINQTLKRLLQRVEEGDIRAAEEEREALFRLYRMELEWITTQVIEGKIRKRK